MPRYLKNASGGNRIVGGFNWLKGKTYDIDMFGKIWVIKTQETLRTLIDAGDLRPVDKWGNWLHDITVAEVSTEEVYEDGLDYIDGKEEMVEKVDDIENDEKYVLNRVGDRRVLKTDTLKRVLLMDHYSLSSLLLKGIWHVDDEEDLRLIRKFHGSSNIKNIITNILKRLEEERAWQK